MRALLGVVLAVPALWLLSTSDQAAAAGLSANAAALLTLQLIAQSGLWLSSSVLGERLGAPVAITTGWFSLGQQPQAAGIAPEAWMITLLVLFTWCYLTALHGAGAPEGAGGAGD